MRTHALLALVAAATLAATSATLSVAQEQPAQPVTVPPPTTGDVLTVPAPASTSVPASAMPTLPARGTSMDSVKAKFGAPAQEVPPVGTPAITRWDYSDFTVFFENDKVLHSVVAARPS